MNDIHKLIKNSKSLDNEKQIELIKIYRETGNLIARDKLINSYYKMISKIINKYKSIAFEDLFNEGVIGIIKAIDGYNLDSGNLFSTYAYKSISTSIFDYVVKNKEPISYPLGFLAKRIKYNKLLEKNPNLTDIEAKQILNVSSDTLMLLKKNINVTYYEDNSNEDNIDFKESQYFKSLDPLDNIEDLFYQKQLIDLIFNKCDLNDEEKTALNYLYIKDLPLTLIENMGYSRKSVNKNKEKALKKVRKVFFKNGIKYN